MKLDKSEPTESEMLELIKRRNDAIDREMERKYHEDKMESIRISAERRANASQDARSKEIDDETDRLWGIVLSECEAKVHEHDKRSDPAPLPTSERLLKSIRAEREGKKYPASTYLFPSSSEMNVYFKQLKSVSDERLISAMRHLGSKFGDSKGKPYKDIRNLFCAVQIELNKRKLIAPAFRKFRQLHKFKDLDDNDKLLSNDCRVIEIHYLHLNHPNRINPYEVQYRKLFDGSEFDFSLASSYASEAWKGKTKINKSFKIPDRIQKELVVLCNKKIKAKHIRIQQKSKKIEQELMEQTLKAESRLDELNVPDYINSYKCLKLTDGSPSEAVELLEKMTGHKSKYKTLLTARETMRKRKKWFENNLGVSKW